MTPEFRTVRRLFGGVLAALLPLLATAVPVMDGLDFADVPVAESRHDAGTCPTGHDHTICTQAGANLAAVAASPAGPRSTVFVVPPPAAVRIAPEASYQQGPPSRAPPLG